MTGRMERGRQRRTVWLLAATAAVAVYAAAVAATGGYDVRMAGLRLRSHSWARPALVAAAGAALLAALARAQLAGIMARVWRAVDAPGGARLIVSLAMAWTLCAGLLFGTFASGGADSYGYVSQARLLASGRLTDTIAVAPAFAWPDVDATLTPLGFTRGQSPGVIAPKYPPGLPLLMVPLALISEHAIYWLVPVLGALTIWLTYRLGAGLGDPLTGAAAAVVLAASPTFLYQVIQPMSDVPVTACWLGAMLLASRGSVRAAAAAGALSSLAVMIRPNLAPLAGLMFVSAVVSQAEQRVSGPSTSGSPSWTAASRALAFVAALLPGVVALGWIQEVRYGSPLASGYGTIRDGFSASNILPNLARYPRWLTESHTWFIWLSLLAPFWIAHRTRTPDGRLVAHADDAREPQARPSAAGLAQPARRAILGWTAVLLTLAIWAAYLPYAYFQPSEWFYTRFLLPAIPAMLFFATAVSLQAVRRLPPAPRTPVTAGLLAWLVVVLLQSAEARGTFTMRADEGKYPRAGAFVRDRLPPTAFVLAAQHSGSIRYYANRPTLRWDLLAPDRLDEALAILRAQGHEPFLVVDRGEDDEFRRKFAAAGQHAVITLPPLAVLGDARVYGFGR